MEDPKDKREVDIHEKLKELVGRMSSFVPTIIQLEGKRNARITNSLLDKLCEGISLTWVEWFALVDLFVCQRFDVITLGDESPALKPRQRGIMFMGRNKNKSIPRWFAMLEGGSTEAKLYTTQALRIDTFDYQPMLSRFLNVEEHKISTTFHRELPISGGDWQPYEDGIMFDMLLDLVRGEFKPHTRTLSDGPCFHLEILQALELELIANSTTSKKRKLSVVERLYKKPRLE